MAWIAIAENSESLVLVDDQDDPRIGRVLRLRDGRLGPRIQVGSIAVQMHLTDIVPPRIIPTSMVRRTTATPARMEAKLQRQLRNGDRPAARANRFLTGAARFRERSGASVSMLHGISAPGGARLPRSARIASDGRGSVSGEHGV